MRHPRHIRREAEPESRGSDIQTAGLPQQQGIQLGADNKHLLGIMLLGNFSTKTTF
jgi:hypothetical protein